VKTFLTNFTTRGCAEIPRFGAKKNATKVENRSAATEIIRENVREVRIGLATDWTSPGAGTSQIWFARCRILFAPTPMTK
jgi:hypothetical protein